MLYKLLQIDSPSAGELSDASSRKKREQAFLDNKFDE